MSFPQWYGTDGMPISMEEANELLGDSDARRVALTRIGIWEISTVFLSLDHNFSGEGPPLLWETMMFCRDGGDHQSIDLDMRRYSSREDAERGHEEMVAQLRQLLDGIDAIEQELNAKVERDDQQ